MVEDSGVKRTFTASGDWTLAAPAPTACTVIVAGNGPALLDRDGQPAQLRRILLPGDWDAWAAMYRDEQDASGQRAAGIQWVACDARPMTSHPRDVSGDGVALTSALHPSNPDVMIQEDISPSPIETGEYDSETGEFRFGNALVVACRTDDARAEVSPLVQRNVIPEEAQRPARDAIPFVREAPVTDEMRRIGAHVDLITVKCGYEDHAEAIYRAMHAVAPTEPVSEGERIAVRERDAACADLKNAYQEIARLHTNEGASVRTMDAIDGYQFVYVGSLTTDEWKEMEEFLLLAPPGVSYEFNRAPKKYTPDLELSGAKERVRMVLARYRAVVAERDEARAMTDAIIKSRNCAARYDVDQVKEMKAGYAATIGAYQAEVTGFRSELAARDTEIAHLRDRIASLPDAPAPDYHGPTADGRATPSIEHERFHESVKDVLAGKIMTSARRQMQEALKQVPREAPTTASTSVPMPGKALTVGGDPRGMGLA